MPPFSVNCPFCGTEAEVWDKEEYRCPTCEAWTEEGEWMEWDAP